MANVLIEETTMTAIGNAIREKTGKTDLILPVDMPTEIGSIESGGSEINNQDKTITANGTYAADEGFTGLGNVTVDVATSGGGQELLDAVLDRSITEVSSNVKTIPIYTFSECSSLTTANFPLVTTIGERAFSECSSLTTANFPLVTTIDGYSFNGCSSLTTVNIPLATSIGNNGFYGCKSLKTVNFPLVSSVGTQAFYKCSALTMADFSSATSFVNYSLRSTNLTSLILRNTETICTLKYTNVFNSTPIESGAGYIYVPSALIEQYKVATNWSTFASQFRALEDYTVDGTVTGELDETKI